MAKEKKKEAKLMIVEVKNKKVNINGNLNWKEAKTVFAVFVLMIFKRALELDNAEIANITKKERLKELNEYFKAVIDTVMEECEAE